MTRSGSEIQDWDTLEAMDMHSLARTLAHVKETGALPPRLGSIQDLNEASESGVSGETVSSLREAVRGKLSAANAQVDASTTLVFLEGFLLYSPQHVRASTTDGGMERRRRDLKAVHESIDLRLFLPAPYDLVKTRRESRSGYVTAGPAPLPQRRSSVSDGEAEGEPDLQREEQEGDRPQQTFWTDPPGYVDDVVWPRYVCDHAWLLVEENGEDLAGVEDEEELVRMAGQATSIRTDAGVEVAPGRGLKPMAEVLQWAVDEVVKQCTMV
jgi:nicotinamide/nicotinate riboside kinase